jgi:predicted small integral membrane protein
LVDVVTGAVGSSEAHALLNSVNYEAEVTWNEATSMSKRDNIGNLIVALFALIGIILFITLIFGIFFGGIRILLKRLFPDRVFDRPEDVEIIQLHLR